MNDKFLHNRTITSTIKIVTYLEFQSYISVISDLRDVFMEFLLKAMAKIFSSKYSLKEKIYFTYIQSICILRYVFCVSE